MLDLHGYGWLLFDGLQLTIVVSLCAISSPAYLFVFYFRGTPLLVQIFLIYYDSGQFRHELTDLGLWGFFRDPWFCGILALVLNTTAYSAEIFRGAISTVPRNDIEAGRACGMSELLLFRHITMPKPFRIGLPAYGNEVVFYYKPRHSCPLLPFWI